MPDIGLISAIHAENISRVLRNVQLFTAIFAENKGNYAEDKGLNSLGELFVVVRTGKERAPSIRNRSDIAQSQVRYCFVSKMHLQKDSTTPSSAQSVDWLIGKLDWGHTLRSWIPAGFESYARILHPAYIIIGKDWSTREVPMPWIIVSEWSGKPLHATSHIQDLMVRADGHDWRKGGEGGSEPHQGELERTSLSCLLTHLAEKTSTPNEIWMLIWTGYGGPADTIGLPVEVSEPLTGSGRKYVLCLGAIVSLEDESENPPVENPPTFWWPADRSWFASSDIDASSTYVGGSHELIEKILNDPSLEAFPANLDDPYGGFYVRSAVVENENDYVLPRFRLWPFRQRFRLRKGSRPSSSEYLTRKKRFWE